MNKIRFTILLISLFFTSMSFALQCPINLTCNYDTGLCDMPNTHTFVLDSGSAQEPFTESQTMIISKIIAYKQGSIKQGSIGNETYHFVCRYKYGNYSS